MNRSIFQIWKPNVPRDMTNMKNIKTMNINFGPQHPAAHGVLRLILQLNGRELLTHAGKISHQIAVDKSTAEYKTFKKQDFRVFFTHTK